MPSAKEDAYRRPRKPTRWPRLMTLQTAAEYLEATQRQFLLWVADGTMPTLLSTSYGNRWDRDEIDDAIDAMKSGARPWDDWRKHSKLYSTEEPYRGTPPTKRR